MAELLDVVNPPTDQRVNVRVRDEAVRRSVHLDAQCTVDEYSVTKDPVQCLPPWAAHDGRQVGCRELLPQDAQFDVTRVLGHVPLRPVDLRPLDVPKQRSTDDRDLPVCCDVSLPSCVCQAGGEGAPSGSPVAPLVLAYLSLL